MTASLTALLHLCDSLFPLGAFAHSDGLESATSEGRVRTAEDMGGWLETVLEQSLGRVEGPAVARAHRLWSARDVGAIVTLDAELHALRPSSTGRDGSRAMGTRLLKTWNQLRPGTLEAFRFTADASTASLTFTLPVAFGIVAGASSIGAGDAVTGYCYTRLAASISAAMRLMPLGQHEAHARLIAALDRVPALVQRILESAAVPLQSFTPAMDLAMMRQQYGHSRLFRS
jgi:urease accessory protein